VANSEPRTPIMMVGIPKWVDEGAVKSGLIQAGVAPQEWTHSGKSSISLRTNPEGSPDSTCLIRLPYRLL